VKNLQAPRRESNPRASGAVPQPTAPLHTPTTTKHPLILLSIFKGFRPLSQNFCDFDEAMVTA